MKKPKTVWCCECEQEWQPAGAISGKSCPNCSALTDYGRAAIGLKMLHAATPGDIDEPEIALLDALANLMHYAAQVDLDFLVALKRASDHFACEQKR